MEIYITSIVAGVLVALGLITARSQYRSYQKAKSAPQDDTSQRELRFRTNQNRRRLQLSAMLAVLGVGIFCGQFIPDARLPTVYVLYWCGLMGLLLWIVLLAFGDLLALQRHAVRLNQDYQVQEAKIQAEISRYRREVATQSNGSGDGEDESEPKQTQETRLAEQEDSAENGDPNEGREAGN